MDMNLLLESNLNYSVVFLCWTVSNFPAAVQIKSPSLDRGLIYINNSTNFVSAISSWPCSFVQCLYTSGFYYCWSENVDNHTIRQRQHRDSLGRQRCRNCVIVRDLWIFRHESLKVVNMESYNMFTIHIINTCNATFAFKTWEPCEFISLIFHHWKCFQYCTVLFGFDIRTVRYSSSIYKNTISDFSRCSFSKLKTLDCTLHIYLILDYKLA
jgi:hypothetical protein